ncbi:FtsX-like permease family protein [Streptomyces sp. Da 82-17]|uniref:FtsX-like permease family protein n=1 Tax=Streptomyces sp. Da 82-17 TaxID=3377116 RepID=UPI0038D45A8D
MWRATWANLRAEGARLVLTLTMVLIGTGFVSAALVFSESLAQGRASLPRDLAVLVAPAGGRAGQDEGGLSQGGQNARTLAPGELGALARVDGVRSAHGVVDGYAALVGPDGEVVVPPGFDQRMSATNWTGGDRLRLASGSVPEGRDRVAISRAVAAESGLGAGDTATVLHGAGTVRVTVSGVFDHRPTGRETSSAPGLAFDTRTALGLLGTRGTYTSAQLTADPGTSPAALGRRAGGVLPGGFEAVDRGRLAAEQAAGARGLTTSVRTTALTFAVISLVVAATLITNTFSMLVARRSRELALLRAVGATRRQLRRAVLAESAAVGLVGSLLGFGLGLLMAWPALGYAAGFDPGLSGELLVSPLSFGLTVAAGTALTVLAAWLPARRAATVAPAAALVDAPVVGQQPARLRRRIGLAVSVPAVLLLAAACTGTSGGQAAAGLFGALLLFLAVLLLVPSIVGRLTGPLAERLRRRPVAGLAVENVRRHPRRTAATTSALMIGVALAGAVSVFAASITDRSVKDLGAVLGGDHVVVNLVGGQVGSATERKIRDLPGVARTTTLRTDALTVDGARVEAGAVDPAAVRGAAPLVRLDLVEGRAGDLAKGVFVTRSAARQHGWALGDRLTVSSPRGGSRAVEVTGVVTDAPLTRSLILPDELADRHFRPGNGNPLLVAAAPGADRQELEAVLGRAVADRPDLRVQDNEAYVRGLITEIDAFLGVTGGLLGLSVLIAFLGILNTLALSVSERTRELGLLRAVGMTRRQIRRTVSAESVLLALVGGVLGAVVGIVGGAMFQHAVVGQPVFALTVPLDTVALALLVCLLGGLLAAALPARRAARVPVLEAVAAD